MSLSLFLKRKLFGLQAKNKRFSLRAFAARCKVSHSFMSQVLSGKRSIRKKTISTISKSLKLTAEETELLYLLAELYSVDDPERKDHLLSKIEELSAPTREKYLIKLKNFSLISKWYYNPIIELSKVKKMVFKPEIIAKCLGITVFEADMAVSQLVEIGILKKENGSYVKTQKVIELSPNVPSREIQKHHEQMIDKALGTLSKPLDERYIAGMTLAVDRGHIESLNKEITEFFKRMSIKASTFDKKNDVYQLNIQFFSFGAHSHLKDQNV